jgi:hypothetical protein
MPTADATTHQHNNKQQHHCSCYRGSKELQAAGSTRVQQGMESGGLCTLLEVLHCCPDGSLACLTTVQQPYKSYACPAS